MATLSEPLHHKLTRYIDPAPANSHGRLSRTLGLDQASAKLLNCPRMGGTMSWLLCRKEFMPSRLI